MADFGNHRWWYGNRPAGQMETGEQIRTCLIVLLVAIGGRNERARVADDYSGASEAVGQHVVVIAAEVMTTAGERSQPRRWPLGRRGLGLLPAGLGEDGGHTLIGQLLDETPQLVPLCAHCSRVARSPSTSLPQHSGSGVRPPASLAIFA